MKHHIAAARLVFFFKGWFGKGRKRLAYWQTIKKTHFECMFVFLSYNVKIIYSNLCQNNDNFVLVFFCINWNPQMNYHSIQRRLYKRNVDRRIIIFRFFKRPREYLLIHYYITCLPSITTLQVHF